MKKELIIIVLLIVTMNGSLFSQNIPGYYTARNGHDYYTLLINRDSTYVVPCYPEGNFDTCFTAGRWKQIDESVLDMTSQNYLNPVEPSYVVTKYKTHTSDSLYFKFILPPKMNEVLASDYLIELNLDSCVVTSSKASFALCKQDYYKYFAHPDSVLFDFNIYKKETDYLFENECESFIHNKSRLHSQINLKEYNAFTIDYTRHTQSFFTTFDSNHELAYRVKKNRIEYHGLSFKKSESLTRKWYQYFIGIDFFRDKATRVTWIGRYINSFDSTQTIELDADSSYFVFRSTDTIGQGTYEQTHDHYFKIINQKSDSLLFFNRKLKQENKASQDSLYFKIQYPKHCAVDFSQLRYSFELDNPHHNKVWVRIQRVSDSIDLPHWRDAFDPKNNLPAGHIRLIRIPESADLSLLIDSLSQPLSQTTFVVKDTLFVISKNQCAEIALRGDFAFTVNPYLNIAYDSIRALEISRVLSSSILLHYGIDTWAPNTFYLNYNQANYYTLVFTSYKNGARPSDYFCIKPDGNLYFQGNTWEKQ